MDELELLIIQPTPFCNINCDYCYLPFRHNTAVMTQEVLAATLQRAFESSNLGSSLTIVWHAGEPFVVPLEFYRNAWSIVTELAPPNCDVHFSFQTNGTLITPAWCAFIRHTRSRVGLSIDGPPYIHDQQRKYRSGKGTHKDAMKGVAHLKAHGIPFHIISVVSRVSLPYARELYFFMKDTGCPAWAFNIEALHGDNRRRSFADAADDGDIRSFVRELFTLWYNDATRPRIREFDGLLHAIREGKTAKMQEARPFAIVNVGVDGNFSTFSPELLDGTQAMEEWYWATS
jgi:uncharacterized protein